MTLAQFYPTYPFEMIEKVVKMEADVELARLVRGKRAEKELKAKLEIVEAYGDDDFDEGVILYFEKQFSKNATVYNYAALKTNGQWYATGRVGSFQRGTWDELVLALVSGDFPLHPANVYFYLTNNAAGSIVQEAPQPATSWHNDSEDVSQTVILPTSGNFP